VWLSLCGIIIIVLSLVLIKYRDNYDDNRKIKGKSEAWLSINNNLTSNKVIGLLPKHGILIFYFVTFILIIISGCYLVSENKTLKKEQLTLSSSIYNINKLTHSIDSSLFLQIQSIDSLKTKINRLESKMDTIIVESANNLNKGDVELIVKETIKRFENQK
jgi:hypothetical protein